MEHCGNLRAITVGRSARTTPVVSRLQTLRAEEAHSPVRTQEPYPLRQVLCRFKQKEDRVRSPQAGLENVKCEPGRTFTSRRRYSDRRNCSGGREQQS
jgi:hypothetical protein